MNITELTVHELLEKLKNKELTSAEITKAYVDRINEKEKDVQAFITPLTDEAIKKAEHLALLPEGVNWEDSWNAVDVCKI